MQTEQPSQALASVSEMLTEERPEKLSSKSLKSKKLDKTTLRVVVNVGKCELEMLRTSNAATGSLAPLARFTIENLWVAFRYCAGPFKTSQAIVAYHVHSRPTIESCIQAVLFTSSSLLWSHQPLTS